MNFSNIQNQINETNINQLISDAMLTWKHELIIWRVKDFRLGWYL